VIRNETVPFYIREVFADHPRRAVTPSKAGRRERLRNALAVWGGGGVEILVDSRASRNRAPKFDRIEAIDDRADAMWAWCPPARKRAGGGAGDGIHTMEALSDRGGGAVASAISAACDARRLRSRAA
jgi:hypothetical protein